MNKVLQISLARPLEHVDAIRSTKNRQLDNQAPYDNEFGDKNYNYANFININKK